MRGVTCADHFVVGVVTLRLAYPAYPTYLYTYLGVVGKMDCKSENLTLSSSDMKKRVRMRRASEQTMYMVPTTRIEAMVATSDSINTCEQCVWVGGVNESWRPWGPMNTCAYVHT